MGTGSLIMMLVVTSVIGGLLHLDRTAAFQFLISRPLVSSTVTGLVLGDMKTGLLIGMVLELLWLDTQPLGTALPPDDTIVAVVVPASAVITGRLIGSTDIPLLGLTVLVSLPLSEAGKLLDTGVRRMNGAFLARAKVAARNGDISGVQRQHFAGLASFFFFFTVFSGIGIVCVFTVTRFLYPHLPRAAMVALTWIFWSLPFFGSGALLGRKKGLLAFGTGYVAAYGTLVFLWGGID
jgi:mannose/fructose/N-acetylgalactosamine-specific phosphotransferase system component IIC